MLLPAKLYSRIIPAIPEFHFLAVEKITIKALISMKKNE